MTQSIRSFSRRSSKELKRSSTDVTSGSRTELFPTKQSTTLAAIQREEADDISIIYSIREEIINNVLDECLKRNREASTVKYMVRCAYEAIKRIIELEFNMHDFGKEDFENSEAWMPDSKPMHSPPDTWAAFNVPVVSYSAEDEEPPDKMQEAAVVTVSTKLSESLGESSKTTTEQSIDMTPQQSLTSLVEQYLTVPHTSEVELEEHSEAEGHYLRKEKSVFTTLMTCSTESNPFTQYSTALKWREQSQRIPKVSRIHLETKPSKVLEPQISIANLPPLRAEAQLKIVGSFAKEETKKDAKK